MAAIRVTTLPQRVGAIEGRSGRGDNCDFHDVAFRGQPEESAGLHQLGSPVAGTPVMAASPLAALDLPLKVLIWDDEGQTKVSYYAPAALAASHPLPDGLAQPGRHQRPH